MVGVAKVVETSATFNSTWIVVERSVLVDSDESSESTVVEKNESKIDSVVVDLTADGLVLGAVSVVVGRVSVTDSTVVSL